MPVLPSQTLGLPAADAAACKGWAARSAQPTVCLERLNVLLPALGGAPAQWPPAGALALCLLLGGSAAASRYLLAEPRLARCLLRRHGAHIRRRKPRATLFAEVRQLRAGAADLQELAHLLRRYRVQEWLRIAARCLLCRRQTPDILAEQSDVAEAILATLLAALRRRDRSLQGPYLPRGACVAGSTVNLAVLAQGKLGARELNLSSDVDLQFLWHHHGELPRQEGLLLAARFTRLAQQFIGAASAATPGGFMYRVDVDLRPEGKKGPLLCAVIAAEHYYETVGAPWERLALMRGRHLAGASWVSDALLRACRPFIYPRTVDHGLVEAMAALKRQLQQEAPRRHLGGLNLKLAPGGIREVELFVQLLQLLFGGRTEALRTTGLLAALQALHQAGVLSEQQARILRDAYLVLRCSENALQAMDEQQTHTVPADPERLVRLGKLLGRRHPDRLLHQLQRTCRRVSRLTRPLFADPAAAPRPAADGAPLRRFVVALRPGTQQLAQLAALGFAAPAEASHVCRALRQAPGSPFSPSSPPPRQRLAPMVLACCAGSPDPQQALRLWAQLEASLRRHPSYLSLLVQTPLLCRRLIDLLGSSEFLGKSICLYPELLDVGLGSGLPAAAPLRGPAALQATLTAGLRAAVSAADADPKGALAYEVQLRRLRRFKLQEQLHLGLLDLAERLPIEALCQGLTQLAEICLGGALEVVRTRWPAPPGSRFCVLGMGRLGGYEMSYGSDLDLLFIYAEGPADDDGWAARLAQRLLGAVTVRLQEGLLYPIDTRLRPSGSQGPLVCSARRFVQYQRQEAALWERQALLRARPVAGDLALGEEVLQALQQVRYPPKPPADLRRHIAAMRQELASTAPTLLDVKLSRGACQDIDFLVQALILEHADAQPTLRQTSTFAGLRALQRSRLLPRGAATTLLRAYAFLRRFEARLRMVRDAPDSTLHADARARSLARRCGYGGSRPEDRLLRHFFRALQQVQQIYDATMR